MTRRLEVAPTSFVGRGRELELIEESLARGLRLVTLLGSPGIGKSRLARWYAERGLESQMVRRVVVCELAEAVGLDDLCAVVGRSLGRGPQGGDRVAEIGAQLSTLGEALVVLDDVERIAAVTARAVSRWLRDAPLVRFLVTSRMALRIVGEAVLALGPLSLPESEEVAEASEAVRLFLDRARLVRPGYELGSEVHDVTAVVRALDGIPLAIELAASRMGVLTAAQLRSSLAQRSDVLRTSAGDARHATLEDAIATSFELLEPHEQSVMAQIAVFRGGFDLEAAAAVVRLPPRSSLLDALQSLVEKSLLVVRPPAMRFDTYSSIREHAERRLEAEEQAEVARRHAAHFCAALPGATSSFLERERDNLLAAQATLVGGTDPSREEVGGAIAIALALEPVLTRWGPPRTFLGTIEAALGAGAADEGLRREALVARARALHTNGRQADSRAAFEGVLAVARREGDEKAEAAAEAGLGELLRELGDLAGAERHLRAALSRLVDDPRRAIAAHTALGHALLVAGRPDEARDHYEAAVRLSERHDSAARPSAEIGLGIAALAASRLDDADEIFRRTDLVVGLPPHFEEIRLVHLSMLRQEQRRMAEALAAAEMAASLARKLGLSRAEGRSLVQLGMVHLEQGDLGRACAALARGTSLLREGGDLRADVLFSAALAVAEARRGSRAEAGRLLRWVDEQLPQAVALASRSSDPLATVVEVYRAAIEGEVTPIDEALSARSHHLRVAQRVAAAAPREPAREGALMVSFDGRWCRLPDGREIHFSRARAQRLMLVELVKERLVAPGRAIALETLFHHGWPGERAIGEAYQNRVYVTLSRLRKRGLGGLIISRDDGFLIDPKVPTFRADGPPRPK